MTELEQEIAHLQELRTKHRKNIHTLEKQIAIYAGTPPLELLNKLEHEQEQLRQVEDRLAGALLAQEKTGRISAAPAELARPPRQAPPHDAALEAVRPAVLERVQPFEPEMVLIPAGRFLMGSDPKVDEYAQGNEQPQHTLYLPDYYLARTPVTNAQYAAFVQATGDHQPQHWKGGKSPSGKEDHPVVYVSWHDAVAYCNWLAEVTGKPYRLPSEAEWEKGARGSDGRIYPWGNEWDAERCNTRESGKLDTTPVGAYPEGASPYGLLDMAGNVSEWTRSVYKKYLYNPDDGREDLEATGVRVLRGGSWDLDLDNARCADRSRFNPYVSDRDLGFRLVSPVLF